MNYKIHLSPPHMSEEGWEKKFIEEAFKINYIAPTGPHVDRFEKEFANYIGIEYAAAVSSGTAALHLLLNILGVKKDDEVLCSTFTFAASANAITYQNAKPVFIDCSKETWNINPAIIEEELLNCMRKGKMPKALITVDLYGQSADYDTITKICNENDVIVIEDAAEALGATYKGKKTGNFGIASAFSFNGNKIITTSGGGMLVAKDRNIVDKARKLATQARDDAPHYQHSEIGYNYRMSNILAAIGIGQLKVLEKRIEQKRRIFNYYKEALSDLPGIEFMPESNYGKSTRWLTCITVESEEFGAKREDIRIKLEENRIESRPLWKPMHMQPVFSDCRIAGGSVSEELFDKGLCLPSGTALKDSELDMICELIRSVHRN